MTQRLDSAVFHLMRKLFQEHTSYWQDALPHVTKPQFSVLHAIAQSPGIEQVDLVEAAITTKATLAELLGRMEKRGLIQRQHGTQDKRRRFVYLTAEGEKLYHASMEVVQSLDMKFLSRISETDHQQLLRILNTLSGNR
ncbi:Transcriptional regulator HosA [Vibrio ruber DSM 16370]|uniref:Transcriptional regulator HosA n=1 Tax=Vibrio ruber (strain DSM 16370 / JCM 11486 / BCRC 17186 / CECT 7878 / LMG 23124 / VR1) TaxID=1123498 RepID=A0A1R4LG51_VIBR1|nr:MarR family transcriptional regulator [Vibrio ruber]SJN55357.1 Transcriptional regulator HosA [Vibrio ruber DSM 16370]